MGRSDCARAHGAAPPTEDELRRLAPAVDAIAVQLMRIAQYRAAVRAMYTEDVWALLHGTGGAAVAQQAGHRLAVVVLLPVDAAQARAMDLERVRGTRCPVRPRATRSTG